MSATSLPIKRILVIDDDADIRTVVQMSLEITALWNVSTCASGVEGAATAFVTQPDAILLDMMMPEFDGAATARRLHDAPETRDIPVILLTAKQESSNWPGALPGVTAVIAKPFDPLTLAERVSALLGWRDAS